MLLVIIIELSPMCGELVFLEISGACRIEIYPQGLVPRIECNILGKQILCSFVFALYYFLFSFAIERE